MYLDDWLGGASTYEQAKIASDKMRSDLISLGFLIADDKSVWEPAQVITWLGFEWNSLTVMSESHKRGLIDYSYVWTR